MDTYNPQNYVTSKSYHLLGFFWESPSSKRLPSNPLPTLPLAPWEIVARTSCSQDTARTPGRFRFPQLQGTRRGWNRRTAHAMFWKLQLGSLKQKLQLGSLKEKWLEVFLRNSGMRWISHNFRVDFFFGGVGVYVRVLPEKKNSQSSKHLKDWVGGEMIRLPKNGALASAHFQGRSCC